VSDRIVLANMRFDGRHGVLDFERENPQPFEVDVELCLDLAPAGRSDDIGQTADYRAAFGICREVVEGQSRQLIEALAETIAARLLAEYSTVGIEEVVVRVRKPKVALPGRLDGTAVEIRRRSGTQP
jgi:7,8-dihydroneopterin aldolase/epimerase/oxygenase